jgi:peroxiredoxin
MLGACRDHFIDGGVTVSSAHDPNILPEDLPVPENDGAADHLPGILLPPISLPTTGGDAVDLSALPGTTVIYIYPRTGRPGEELPTGWDSIPGARGCTPQSCGFRDHFAELKAAGADAVYGVSTQSSDYQREVRGRLNLPFELLSDERLELTHALGLPTFEADGMTLLKRMALIVRGGRIVRVFYPVFPPDRNAEDVLAWLRTVLHPASS